MDSFVFYESFYNAVEKLPKELQAEALEAIVRFGIYGEEYAGEEFAIAVLMELVKANIEAARQKRDAGRRGGRPSKLAKEEKNKDNSENHTLNSVGTINNDENHALTDKEYGLEDEKPIDNNENHTLTKEKGGLSMVSKVSEKEDLTERGEVVCKIMLNQGVHEVRERDVGEWQELYPAVDVKQELRKMVGWAKSNPSQRKTKKGINRFINNWLAREQDRSRTMLKQRSPVANFSDAAMYAGGDSI